VSSDQSPTEMCGLDREFVDQKVRLTNSESKTMITVSVGVDGIALLSILSQGWKLTSQYFHESIIRELAIKQDPRGREPKGPCSILHFDNATVDSTQKLERILEEFELKRLRRLPYSPNLSPCDFYLCRYPREKEIAVIRKSGSV
jgi:hypothetical protein